MIVENVHPGLFWPDQSVYAFFNGHIIDFWFDLAEILPILSKFNLLSSFLRSVSVSTSIAGYPDRDDESP